MGYAKVIHKKREELKKMDKCPNDQKNGYFDAYLKKERKKKKRMIKIAHVFL
jgi:hypothetical protein